MSERQVVTRIAPSPTGSMHIGTARTALFNWLYARRTGGKYLLRIEDTDRERSTDAAVKVILDGLTWLGLEPDETPVFQFARADRHREVALDLLSRGSAYRDYMTPDELAEERERARAEGRVVRSPWRDHDGPVDPGRPHVIRLRAPQEGETRIDDQVKGEVVFRNVDLDDLILLRTDGTPTYNLAVVVDDHDMGVTHVIRGDDHLNNAARQTHIYQAMGWDTPVWAHLPMIHGPDGKKLSKRHGAQAVSEFDDMGYLPEALRNYLAKLGWGHGDDEIFSDSQAAAWFDIRDVVGAPARLDWDKLNHLNNHYIRQADTRRLAGLVEKVLKSRDRPLHDGDREILLRTLPLVRDGARTTLELADAVVFALPRRPLYRPDKALARLTEETLKLADALVFALRHRPLDLPDKALALLTEEIREGLGRPASRLEEEEWKMLQSRDRPLHDSDCEILLRALTPVRDGARRTLKQTSAVVFALRHRPLDLADEALARLTKETMDLADALVFALEQSPLDLPDKALALVTEDVRERLGSLASRPGGENWKELRSRSGLLHDGDREILLLIAPLMRRRARRTLRLTDAVISALKRRPLDLPEKARGLLTDETRARLGRLAARLEGSEWTLPALEATIRAFAETEGVGIGKFGPALRAVLSGGSPAPDLAGALISIGPDESLARIHDALPN